MNSLLLQKNKSTVIDDIISNFTTFLIVIIAIISLMYTIFLPFNIDGTSMLPTLNNGDIALVCKLIEPKKGDITVIDTGKDLEKDGQTYKHYIIKRVIATEGEKVAFLKEDNKITLCIDSGNGFKKINEDYINEEMAQNSLSLFSTVKICSNESELNDKSITVPNNSVFVLGDNRNVSLDSRKYGCFEITNLLGKVIANYEKDSFWHNLFSLFYKSENTTNTI